MHSPDRLLRANSAVCYALEITAIDPVGMELLFERFLSESRGEWPDIDLDLPSEDKREQAIQYVYQRTFLIEASSSSLAGSEERSRMSRNRS